MRTPVTAPRPTPITVTLVITEYRTDARPVGRESPLFLIVMTTPSFCHSVGCEMGAYRTPARPAGVQQS
jgi:hypothetical protein